MAKSTILTLISNSSFIKWVSVSICASLINYFELSLFLIAANMIYSRKVSLFMMVQIVGSIYSQMIRLFNFSAKYLKSWLIYIPWLVVMLGLRVDE